MQTCAKLSRGLFFQPPVQPHQKEVRQDDEGQMMMPAGPTPDFVVAHAQILFADFEAPLYRPAQTGDRDQARGGDRLRRVGEEGFLLPTFGVNPQDQPHGGASPTRPLGLHTLHVGLGNPWPFGAVTDPLARPCRGGQGRELRLRRGRLRGPINPHGGVHAFKGRFFERAARTCQDFLNEPGFLVGWKGYQPHPRGGTHGSFSGIIAMAADRVKAHAAPVEAAGVGVGVVEFRDGGGPKLWRDQCDGDHRAAGGTEGIDGTPAIARMVLRNHAQSGNQTGH